MSKPSPRATPSEPNRPGTTGRNPTGDRPADGSLPKDFRVSAPAVSLPKGGGAIAGMGEKFAANPVTGSASLSIPLPVTQARGGAGPALALSYDSGAGNGPFGLGWRLSLPSVRRKTDRGLPRYRDAGEEADVYVISDAEDLVPMLAESGGVWSAVERAETLDSVAYTVSRYRPRVEGGFAVIERWRRDSDGRIHWRSVARDNTRRVYGFSDSARLVDPDDETHCFEWLLEEEQDERGNVTSYQYVSEDRAGVDPHPAEDRRGSAGNGVAYRYLKRVSYANTDPFQNPDRGGTGSFRLHLVLDYGDHDPEDPGMDPDRTWPARPDAFSSFRSRFDVRCYRLCQRVLMFHRFESLREEEGDPVPVVVRALDLSYTERPTVTTLDSAQLTGWRWNGTGYDTASMPALTLVYVQPEIDETVRLVDGVDDLPGGLDTRSWSWVDLDGEGLAGLLTEQGGSWFYKRNEGGGALGAPRRLGSRPNVSLGAGARLVDLDGDGNLDVVVTRPGVAGFYARDPDSEGGWEGFRSFRQIPTTGLDDPDARLLDLDGDGHADLLISGERVYTWYPSEARDGFGPPRCVAQAADEDAGPRLLFSAQGERIFLADMTGDGLTDLVRITNGSVCYWPNRGYGHFGAKVQMKGAPRLDSPDRFDPSRIRLADVDGSGPTDLLYIGPEGVQIWYNQSGNGFSEATTLSRFPAVAWPNEVQVADLRGDGTACLVWSSPLLSQASRPLRYVHLMKNGKPWLLASMQNGLGRETRLTYTASTAYYVADRRAGTPWATRLPFPVHCLSKVESLDHVTGWRFVQEYKYHHGYFDGPEREFRGFGLVEQWDTETLHDYEEEAHADTEALVTVPPVRTRSWFHTGAWRREQTLIDAYEAEYFDGDEPHEGEEDNDGAHHLTMPDMPSGLTATELREAHRALKGRPLRVEVYAEDGEGNLSTLYTTSETTWRVVRLQPREGEAAACFRVDPWETLGYTYDVAVDADSFDPRVSHTLVLEVDDYGTVLRTAAVAYPRRGEGHDDEQMALTVILSAVEVTHQDTRTAWTDPWHLGVPVRARSWALTEIVGEDPPLLGWTDNGSPATVAGVEAALEDVTSWAFHETPTGEGVHQRLLSDQITLYWDDTLSGPLTLGSVGERALVYERYALTMPEGLIDEVFDTLVGTSELEEAGYVDLLEDGDAWLPSGRLILDEATFYQPVGHRDPWGNESSFTWDEDALTITEATDALDLTVEAEIDYQWISPSKLTDPNGTESEARFDALGRVIATFVRHGTDGDGTEEGDESAQYTYETDRWTEDGEPVRVTVELREAHGGTDWLVSHVYSDGGGNVVQTVTEAEPDGETERWIASGRVEIDNKGNIIRQYEPFYTTSAEFDYTPAGVSAVLAYDPVGRNTTMTLPDGHVRSWSYNPWWVSAADENDNFDDEANLHFGTPTVTHLDSLGRVYQTVELTEIGGEELLTALTLDVQGNPLAVIDPRGNTIQVQTFDMVGRPLFTGAADEGYDPDSPSTDKGQTRALLDVQSKPLRTWRSGDLALRQTFDAGRRPLALYVTEDSATRLVTLTLYGDALSDTPSASFARGRPLHVYDTAGRLTLAYDFRGRTVTQTRQVFEDIETEADWDGLEAETSLEDVETWVATNGDLDAEEHTITTSYDALDRVTSQSTPDGSVLTPGYDAGGKLQTVSVEILEEVQDFVTDITYNARGQRETITYGNHTATTTTYDANRFWPTRILTERDDTGPLDDVTLQDLNITRDPVGNITQITDAAHEPEFFSNAQVTPTRTFTYDALYRLISATGREKVDQIQTSAWYSVYAGTPGSLPDPGNPALRTYTQTYTYDVAGNLLEMAHVPSAGTGWRRGYDVATKNNQLLKSSVPGDDPDDPDTYSDLYTYNARGAMVFMPHLKTGVSTNLTRDFRDQIRRADTDNAGTVAHYAYDAGGQRVRKVVVKGSVQEERIYLGSYEVWRRRSSGTLTQERQTLHVLDGQRRIALVETLTVDDDPIDPEDREPRLRYQLDDHLGTALLETDQDGAVISYEEYHPYGSTAWYADDGTLEASPKRYRYTGMERDDETGMQYHSARYYVPWLGRWESADPLRLIDGLNRHQYVGCNPSRSSDPSGCQSAGEADYLSWTYWETKYDSWEADLSATMTEYAQDLTGLGSLNDIVTRGLSAGRSGERISQEEVDQAQRDIVTGQFEWTMTSTSFATVGINPESAVTYLVTDRMLSRAAVDVVYEGAGEATIRAFAQEILLGKANASGARSVAEALDLFEDFSDLQTKGYSLRLVVDPALEGTSKYAYYNASNLRVLQDASGRAYIEPVELNRIFQQDRNTGERFALVRVSPDVLISDESIVNVLTHEVTELNWLYGRLSKGSVTYQEYVSAVGGEESLGWLHHQAIIAGNKAMELFRSFSGVGP